VTVATINAELAGVMTMTEWHGLLTRDEGLGNVGRPIDQIESIAGSGDHEERSEDTDPRNRVRAAVKDLGHERAG
jgi:hypothetical protein